MSVEDGWAALNLSMPERVPRTELSVTTHWELVKRVTGINVGVDSSDEAKKKAGLEFMRIWDFDLSFRSLISRNEIRAFLTNMGHSVWAAGMADWDDNVSYPFNDVEEAFAFDPWSTYGEKNGSELRSRFEDHYRISCNDAPWTVNTTGITISLVTGLTYIFGWEMLLLAAGTDPKRFGEVANLYTSWIQQYYNALAETDVPVCYCHDDIVWARGAVFHPDWYRTYVFPNLRKLFEPLIEAGKKVIYVSDGNYMEFLEDILDLGVHGLFFEAGCMDLGALAERCGQTHVLVGGVDTRVLLSGSRDDIREEVGRNMKIGKNCPGYVMCVSNAIPHNTPVENALYYNEVYEQTCLR